MRLARITRVAGGARTTSETRVTRISRVTGKGKDCRRNRKKQEETGRTGEGEGVADAPALIYNIYRYRQKGRKHKRGVCGRGDYGQTSHTATEWVAGTNFELSIFHFQLNHYLCVPQKLRNTEL